jgi:Zn finger protein HypA/HybF involved in hydrogenase expression
MGAIIEARCPCGFESGIKVGGGFKNFKEVCAAPALCMKCMRFVIENYYDKDSTCPECGEKVTFYNDPKLQAPNNEIEQLRQSKVPFDRLKLQMLVRDVFCWGRPEDEFQFRLPNLQYLCPKCGKLTMKFVEVGSWD